MYTHGLESCISPQVLPPDARVIKWRFCQVLYGTGGTKKEDETSWEQLSYLGPNKSIDSTF